jgi:hypothetical protein
VEEKITNAKRVEHYALLQLLENQPLLVAEKIEFCKTSVRLMPTDGADRSVVLDRSRN